MNIKTAFSHYLKSQKRGKFNETFRRTVLTVQHVLPEAATTTRKAALMVHSNSWKNLVCRLHIASRNHPRDGQLHNNSQIHGVGHQPTHGTAENPAVPPPGHMHCGCLIDDVLLDFFLWKTLKICSTNPKLEADEGMAQQVMAPRMRSFFVAVFRQFSGLTIDDLYTGIGTTVDDLSYRTRLGLLQAQNFINLLRESGVPAKLVLLQTDKAVVDGEYLED